MLTLQELSGRFAGVTWRGRNSFQAKCPCHDDRQASLTVSDGDRGIVLYCHSGCVTENILQAVGLTFADIMPQREKPVTKGRFDFQNVVAEYQYRNGTRKLRDRNKNFLWQHREPGGSWRSGRGKADHVLYQSGTPQQTIFLLEGEKDTDNLASLGLFCVSAEDGAGSKSKWHSTYTEELTGMDVVLIPDNDNIGRQFAEDIAAQIDPVTKSLKVIDLRKIWPDLPEKGDVSDLIQHYGKDRAPDLLKDLEAAAEPWTPFTVTEKDSFLSCFKPLTAFEEKDPEWLIPYRMPKGQIVLFGADGGVGKTSIAIDTIAAISSGKGCLLDDSNVEREPLLTAFLSTEDSVSQKLKRKLREAGANMDNVICPDFSADQSGLLRDFKFGTEKMAGFIEHYKPALCVFDPLQGFTPVNVNMGQRNQMRDCLAPFIGLGETYGTTFLILCHTNKRKGAYGRDRIADSADLWDIARSVLMVGYTDKPGQRYLSHEKSNYGELSETILFSIKEGAIVDEGRTWKRDREWQEAGTSPNSAPKRHDCKDWIITRLESENGVMKIRDLEAAAKDEGFTAKIIRQAKDELKEEDRIYYRSVGFGNEKSWMIYLTD